MSSSDPSNDINLRVHAYYPTVPSFSRKEDGSRDMGSISGPGRIEARQQESRERMVAGAELRVLQERLRWCYHKEGVNHYENCKGIAEAYLEKLRVHDSWLLKVREAARWACWAPFRARARTHRAQYRWGAFAPLPRTCFSPTTQILPPLTLRRVLQSPAASKLLRA